MIDHATACIENCTVTMMTRPMATNGGNQSSMVQQAISTPLGIGKAVDLSGDGGVMREMLQEGDGKGLATGDIGMVCFTGTVEETGQVRCSSHGHYGGG